MDDLGRRPAGEARSFRVIVATMSCEAQGERPIVVRNISPKGLGARLRFGRISVGVRVTLMVRGHSLHGEVRWSQGDLFGVELNEEIDPSMFVVSETSLDDLQPPFGRGHVFDQFRPVSDSRRPGFRTR